MKLITLLANKKRAISPVISVILLIALAVAAAAAIFLVVLPLLETTTNLQINDAYVEYDDAYTTAADVGRGYGTGTLILSNAGSGEIEIVSLSVSYADSVNLTANWIKIDNHDKLDITTDNPYVIAPLAALEELTVRFLIPKDNNNETISYRITITTDGGDELDTATVANIDETEMQLRKDRPDISFTGTLGYIRRTQTISPTTVSDNSAIKNVTYEVATDPGITNIVQEKTVKESLWRWQWDTFNDTTEGLDNDSYYLRMTVYDYAGLLDKTGIINFTIDNDYVDPEINGLWVTAPYPNTETAEVGESVSLTAEIIDGGTAQASASQVDSAYLYYRLNGTANNFALASMNKYGTTNNWTVNIPSSFLDSDALESGIESYISATDLVGNTANSSGTPKMIQVNDNYAPDISHTPIVTGSSGSLITINATITDEDQVNQSSITLYWRQTNDFGGVTTSWTSVSPYISGDEYSWYIWGSQATIHGLDYFFNATDRFSGHVAYEGSELVPNHISIPDTQSPIVYHDPVTSAIDDVNLVLSFEVWDNDPTFGSAGSETGQVTIGYRNYITGGPYVYPEINMTRFSGDSSISSNSDTPENTTWIGTIPASAIVDDENPSRLDYYIKAVDQSSNTKQHGTPSNPHEVTVLPQGTPNLVYVSGSVLLTGTANQTVQLEIKNISPTGYFSAANISALTCTIYGNASQFVTFYPKLNTTTFNSTQVWTDANGVLNNTRITFTTNFTLAEEETAIVKLTFENTTTGQAYDMHDLNLTLKFEGVNAKGTPFSRTLRNITTPSSVVQPGGQTMIEKRYMNSDFSLLTTGTTNPLEGDTGWINLAAQPQIVWGVRVFVGTTEITSGMEANVTTGVQGSYVLQTGGWNCPQTSLQSIDTIRVSVRVSIDNTEYVMAEFTTNQLGATELSAATWTVQYWIQWDKHQTQNRWRALFGYGDINSYDSFVDNFVYVT